MATYLDASWPPGAETGLPTRDRRSDPYRTYLPDELGHRPLVVGPVAFERAADVERAIRGVAGGPSPRSTRPVSTSPCCTPRTSTRSALNSKFSLDLGEADTLLVEQYVVQSTQDPEMRAVALENSEENFGCRFDERVDDFVIDRQNANEALFSRYFDDPDFQSVLVEFVRKEAYRRIRGGEAA